MNKRGKKRNPLIADLQDDDDDKEEDIANLHLLTLADETDLLHINALDFVQFLLYCKHLVSHLEVDVNDPTS